MVGRGVVWCVRLTASPHEEEEEEEEAEEEEADEEEEVGKCRRASLPLFAWNCFHNLCKRKTCEAGAKKHGKKIEN